MRRVTRAAIAATAIAVLSLGGTTAAGAAPGGTPRIPLNNGQETTGAEGGAHGFFTYTIEGDQFCFTLKVKGLTVNASDAHIHRAPQGVAGPVVIPFGAPAATSFEVDRCVTVSNAALLAEITANPRAFYVNVHTATYPGGEVRGQLK
jgi:hypothetical protein